MLYYIIILLRLSIENNNIRDDKKFQVAAGNIFFNHNKITWIV